jgi:hypothetical protein
MNERKLETWEEVAAAHGAQEALIAREDQEAAGPIDAASRGAALLTARLGLAKAELICKATVAHVRQSAETFRLGGRELEALAAELILGSLEQNCKDLLTLQNRAGKVRKGE